MADLLFEIGLEEVPARMIAAAQAELLRRTVALLGRERLLPEGFDELSGADSYSTPRRLAVLVRGVRQRQEDVSEEVTGPAVKIAYKDGVATPAAEAFARKSGVAVADLKTVTTPKGEYLAATSVKAGRSAAEVIAVELPKEVGAIYWAKTMYWRAGKPERFVRPVLWLVCLLGEEVVPLSFGGKTAGRATFGHRVLSNGEPFEIESPESYEAQLAGEYVLVDVEARRHKIRKALDHTTREVAGARWREDEPLVDQVTHLTEWPTVLLGNFEPEYLELPEEVLVTVMRDHQKYFAVEGAEGKLAPHFLTVLNISTDENSAAIIRQGNERVLRARLNDARFFWEFDQRVPLVERMKRLENVTFQKDLGSYAAKSQRVRSLAAALAKRVGETVDAAALDEAARLAKTDLTTELVKEFTELQGVIGGLYARAQGISQSACDAIYDQYKPASMDDGVPRSVEGALLGIADRADTIAGMFGLGLEPTGSKDPFGLRRAANGVIKILAESELPIGIDEVVTLSFENFDGAHRKSGLAATRLKDIGVNITTNADADSGNSVGLAKKSMSVFFGDRLSFYLADICGFEFDVVRAVGPGVSNDVPDAVARAAALTAMRGSADFSAVCAASKRMRNILSQATEKGYAANSVVKESLLIEPAESILAVRATELGIVVKQSSRKKDYKAALEAIATFRPDLDGFFDVVMVLVDDEAIRANRLALIAHVLGSIGGIADFSEIVVTG